MRCVFVIRRKPTVTVAIMPREQPQGRALGVCCSRLHMESQRLNHHEEADRAGSPGLSHVCGLTLAPGVGCVKGICSSNVRNNFTAIPSLHGARRLNFFRVRHAPFRH